MPNLKPKVRFIYKFILTLVTLCIFIYVIWLYLFGRQPDSFQQTFFESVHYIRDVRQIPRPIVAHILRVDLRDQRLKFFVTPGEKTVKGEIRAMTTSAFLTQFNLQVAINGSFFYPFYSHYPWDYYPHVGDSVNVLGLASSSGQIYSEPQTGFVSVFISKKNQISFESVEQPIDMTLSGQKMLLKQGKILISLSEKARPYPRTAIALDKNHETLLMVVVDGKQPGYSEGVTLFELAKIIKFYGGETALNLDGGGSSTMVIRNMQGYPQLLNSPSHTRLPGRERPVANHLGIAINANMIK